MCRQLISGYIVIIILRKQLVPGLPFDRRHNRFNASRSKGIVRILIGKSMGEKDVLNDGKKLLFISIIATKTRIVKLPIKETDFLKVRMKVTEMT